MTTELSIVADEVRKYIADLLHAPDDQYLVDDTVAAAYEAAGLQAPEHVIL